MIKRGHWKKWEDIAVPKERGGMGFRDFQLFNKAMLAKQGWRILTNPNSLCARVLKGKYFHDRDFLSSRTKRGASHIWNAILFGRDALHKGLVKRIGDGSITHIWDDPWIPSNPAFKPLVRLPDVDVNLVQDLIDQNSVKWDYDKLEESFAPIDAQAIAGIPLGRCSVDIWA